MFSHAHTHNHFTALLDSVQDYPGEPAPFNVIMLIEDILQPLLQQMFKLASLSAYTSLEMSPFVSRLINNCLLYARPDCTQTLLQLVFQKSFKVDFEDSIV